MAAVESFPAPRGPLTVTIDHSRPPPRPRQLAAQIESRWAELTAANPRMFNGPLLTVTGADLASGTIECRPDDFKHLAVQDRVKTGTEILAVSGVVIARDRAGREHVLLGQRAAQTRVYGGMWELGPSGGMPVPPAAAGRLSLDDFARHLAEEMREEVGLDCAGAPFSCLGFCRDLAVHSLDVIVRADMPAPVEDLRCPTRDWEYEDVRWVALGHLPAFDKGHADRIIPPTRAFWRTLGWVQSDEASNSAP